MPIVGVDIPAGYTDARKEWLRRGVERAVDEAPAPAGTARLPETGKWIYVSVREAFGEIGGGLPAVTVDAAPERRP